METLTTPARNPHLWRQAKARAGFKSHLCTYLSVNALLWVIWSATTRGRYDFLPWPIWATVFWGIGLVSQGVRVYGGWSKPGLAEREYERLVRAQNSSR